MAHRMGKRPARKETDQDKSEPGEDGKAKVEDEPAPPIQEDAEMIEVEEFYVKFKSYSYLHCDWKTCEELEMIDKRIKQKITRYKQKKEQSYMDDEDEPFDPNYTEVDRVLDEKLFPDGDDLSKTKPYFLCKWSGLPYDESTWEVEEDCDAKKIEEYRRRQIPPTHQERKVERDERILFLTLRSVRLITSTCMCSATQTLESRLFSLSIIRRISVEISPGSPT